MGENGEKSLLKGVSITLAAILGIMAAWAAYTQTTRFTWEDGVRHEARMHNLEVTDKENEARYDEIIIRLTKIESMLEYRRVNP